MHAPVILSAAKDLKLRRLRPFGVFAPQGDVSGFEAIETFVEGVEVQERIVSKRDHRLLKRYDFTIELLVNDALDITGDVVSQPGQQFSQIRVH